MNAPQTQLSTKKLVDYVENMVKIPSPTGFTDKIIDFLAENAAQKGIACQHTRKGAIIYQFEKLDARHRLMFSAHVDTLGAIISSVTKDQIRISSIGSYPEIYIVGDYCTIHTYDGRQYRGTILPQNPSDHLNKKLRKTPLTFADLYVRLDLIPEPDRTWRDYVGNGNFVSFDPRYEYINGFIKARHLDDKAGAAVLLYLADLLAENHAAIAGDNSVYLFFNISEETGQGLAGFPEIDELLVVDMGCVGDNLEGRESAVSICPADALGPYHYRMTKKLVALARENGIDHKIDIFPHYGSDGSLALRAGNDIRVALIGPGVHASHGYERTHQSGLLATLRLILQYLQQ